MKQPSDRQLKWELARERFRLENPYPPPAQRKEKHIRDILPELLDKNGSETAALPEALRDRWPAIAGEQFAQHVRPAHLQSGILYLYADHPGWLAEAKRIPKSRLLKNIRCIKDPPEIKDIRIQLDPLIRNTPGRNR